MVDVVFHSMASAEYAAAVVRYAQTSSRVAKRFELEVEKALSLISDFPESAPRLDAAYRFTKLDRFPFALIYKVTPTGIFVAAVAHTSRSPDYWRDRDEEA